MEKKGLGKGLGALFPSDAGAAVSAGVEIGVDEIDFNPYQPRVKIDDEKYRELVLSVRSHGIIQPIVVRRSANNRYELVAGERRLRAAREVGLNTIPAIVKAVTDQESLQMALIENIQREDIGALDAALAYRRLSEEFDMSQEDIANSLGKSRSAVANTMRLLALPDDIKRMLAAGRLSEGHARALLTIESANDQTEAAHRIIESGLSVRDAERLARLMNDKPAGGNVSRETIPTEKDPNLLEAEGRLREVFGTKVSISKWKDRGNITLEFYSDDDLNRLLNLLCSF